MIQGGRLFHLCSAFRVDRKPVRIARRRNFKPDGHGSVLPFDIGSSKARRRRDRIADKRNRVSVPGKGCRVVDNMGFVVKVDGTHAPGRVRVYDGQVIVGERGPLRGGGKIHVVPAQQDLILQVKLEGQVSPTLTGRAAAFTNPFS